MSKTVQVKLYFVRATKNKFYYEATESDILAPIKTAYFEKVSLAHNFDVKATDPPLEILVEVTLP